MTCLTASEQNILGNSVADHFASDLDPNLFDAAPDPDLETVV
jgi:hypothetical protein